MRRGLLSETGKHVDLAEADIEWLENFLKRPLVNGIQMAHAHGDSHRRAVLPRRLRCPLLDEVLENFLFVGRGGVPGSVIGMGVTEYCRALREAAHSSAWWSGSSIPAHPGIWCSVG